MENIVLKLEQYPYTDKEKVFSYKKITLNPGITPLTGKNGSGKTTILHSLRRYCEKNGIKNLTFDNLRDGGNNCYGKLLFGDDLAGLATRMGSSEGQNIYLNISSFSREIGGMVRQTRPGEKLVIMFDAIDSGLSIDLILEVRNFFEMVKADCTRSGVELYIVFAANSFELCRDYESFFVPTGKTKVFKNYETYKKAITTN